MPYKDRRTTLQGTVFSRGSSGALPVILRGSFDAMAPGKLVTLLMVSMMYVAYVRADGHAHSFQHFKGPVIGEPREVTWKDKHGHLHEDYVAQPHYQYAYGVEDHHTGDYHGQKEHRDGKAVIGEYTVKEPTGNVRTVKYHADESGFHAQVHNSHGNGDGDR